MEEPIYLSNRVPFHPFETPFCVESVSLRRAVYFSFQRTILSRIRFGREFLLYRGAMLNSGRHFAPIMRALIRMQFWSEF